MKIDTYMCTNCYEPKIFKPNDASPHICNKCGKEMEFWCTEELDSITGKVIQNGNIDSDNEKIDIKKIVTGIPTVECPYCHSTNTKKITATSKAVHTSLFGIFSVSRNSKQFHCNSCGADF